MPRIRLTRRALRSPRACALFLALAGLGWTLLPRLTERHDARTPDQHAAPAASADATRRARTAEAYGNLPLSFEANEGQADREVQFLARGDGYLLSLTPTGAVIRLRNANRGLGNEHADSRPRDDRQSAQTNPQSSPLYPQPSVLRMSLAGADEGARAEAEGELPGKSNYLTGSDPSKWRTNVAHFSRVRYREVYPGVDVVYYGNQRRLEYDFRLAPGASTDHIRLAFDGAQKVRVDEESGDLLLETEGGELRQHRPFIYQEARGARREVAGRYVILETPADKRTAPHAESKTHHQALQTPDPRPRTPDSHPHSYLVGFEVAEYDASLPLVIDPVLSYSTYLGGGGEELGGVVEVDASGNVYVSGSTDSTNFPTDGPLQAANAGNRDFVVTKLNAGGTALIYSTYIGGGGAESSSPDIALDERGNVYLTGGTSSADFPTVTPIQAALVGTQDAVVLKLNPAGSALLYSTYLGGTDTGSEAGFGVTVNRLGQAFVAGQTTSPADFPTAAPFQATSGGNSDGFVSKLNATGSALLYSTYLGGGDSDRAFDVAVDNSGNAHVVGQTRSNNFPTASALEPSAQGSDDGFVTKLNAAGSALLYSTYVGGSAADSADDIRLDPGGNAYVSGDTASNDFPTADALQPTYGGGANDAFAFKLDAAGAALLYSTYLGGAGNDLSGGCDVDAAGNFYLTGHTDSADFPVEDAAQPSNKGGGDCFVTKLNDDGSAFVYSTYLGGSGFEAGRDLALDHLGNAYVSGETASADFPKTAGAFQLANGGGASDSFVARLSQFGSCSSPSYAAAPGSPYLTTAGPRAVAAADFNLDGNPDLITADDGATDKVTLLLGDGTGSYDGPKTSFDVGTNPSALVAGDWNNDGSPDIAVTNEGSNDVTVRLGDGAGSFAAAVNVPVGTSPAALAAGDFDADGDTDLLTANFASDDLTVLTNDGAGTFTATSTAATGDGPRSIVAADFDLDGDLDLAVAEQNTQTVPIRSNNGAGAFAPASGPATGGPPVSIATADFNLDGFPDAVTADSTAQSVTVLLGNGGVAFASANTFPVAGGNPVNAVAAGDFNNDTRPDVAVVNGPNVSVLLGNGAGGLGAATNAGAGAGSPTTLLAADLNNDTRPDLATTDPAANNVPVLLNGCGLAASSSLVVNSANDANDGTCNATHCSLREAINASNATASTTETVTFNIPGAGVHTISPASALPPITSPVVIDGYTQPGSSANTLSSGSDAVLLVELAGNTAGAGVSGLQVTAGGGGTTLRGLVINRFTQAGVRFNASSGNTVEGCFLGTNALGTTDLGNTLNGVSIVSGSNNTVGGSTPPARNVISGNNTSGVDLGGGNLSGNVVSGNYIGTNAAGTAAVANGTGVVIGGTPNVTNNTVGGLTLTPGTGLGNVISGNNADGIILNGAGVTATTIRGNVIGLSAAGTAGLGNGNDGIDVASSASATIGGANAQARNVISGNNSDGVQIVSSAGGVIQNNYIGTSLDGAADLGNSAVGINANACANLSVGGAGLGNLVSGNNSDGVFIQGASGGASVKGNFIGTNAAGSADLGNSGDGVQISSSGINVGGATAAERNVISGNNANGINLTGSSANVRGNFIGTDAAGAIDIGNTLNGLSVSGAVSGNVVGGPGAGEPNVIAFNDDDGVNIGGGTGTRVNANSIHSNGTTAQDVGIDLVGANGVNANDANDSDTGSNNLQNSPVLTSAATAGGNTTVHGTLNSNASTIFRVEVFSNTSCDTSLSGEGETFVGSQDVTTDGSGNASINAVVTQVPLSRFITATVTNQTTGDTSEFSACIQETGASATFVVNSNADTADANLADPSCDDGAGNCTLRAAVEQANANPNADTINFNVGGGGAQTISPASAFPAVVHPVTIDGTTQPGFSGAPLVELSGAGAGAGVSGLTINAGSSTVRALAINRFTANGIVLQTAGANTVTGCRIGTSPDGTADLGNAANGILIQSGSTNNTVGGLTTTPGQGLGNVISGNTSDGVEINGATTTGNNLLGNLIGTNASGTAALANSAGVNIVNAPSATIGGANAQARNVISGNAAQGVNISGETADSIVIAGNYVGTDITGAADLGNGNDGVRITVGPDNSVIGGLTSTPGAAPGNVISGNNEEGIAIDNVATTGHTIQGNVIGLNAAGTAALRNESDGVLLINSSSNTIGGASAQARNVISGNNQGTGDRGIELSGNDTDSNLIAGNYIGTDITGTVAIGNADDGVLIGSGDFNTVGGSTPAPGQAPGNLISGNGSEGVESSGSGNLVRGNIIGLDINGTAALGNAGGGYFLNAGTNNVIGGPTADLRNIISGNGSHGVQLDEGQAGVGDNNTVQSNYIGTDISGLIDLGNAGDGLLVSGGDTLVIGGATATPGTAPGNLISGNAGDGIELATAGVGSVFGNLVGLKVNGAEALPNNGHGVLLPCADTNTVGGTSAAERNVISANGGNGIFVTCGNTGNATGNIFQGNYIGTDITGTADLGNTLAGVRIEGFANTHTVGGNAAGAGNLISGNDAQGIVIGTPNGINAQANTTVVHGNLIGTKADGAGALGNGGNGVEVNQFNPANANNAIGGTIAGAANTIAFNGGNGVRVANNVTRNRVSGNSIHSNAGLGIELGAAGVTPNDANDPDAGANTLQNFPTLSEVIGDGGGNTTVRGALNSTADTTFSVEFFSSPACDASGFGEGKVFLGATNVTTDAGGNASFDTVLASTTVGGQQVTATATDAFGNTSEFSSCSLVRDTVAWRVASTGNWSNPANWQDSQGVSRLPGPADHVRIELAGTYAITLDVNASLASLTLGGASGTQTLNVPANTLTLGGASTVNANGVLNLSGGTIHGVGPLTVNGAMNWSAGELNVSTFNLAGGVSLNISGAGGKVLAGAINNSGTVTWAGTGDISFKSGTITNTASATFNIQTDADLNDEDGAFSPAVFDNAGTLRKSAGAAATDFNTVALNNSGTVESLAGTLGVTDAAYTQTAGSTLLNGGNLSANVSLQGGELRGVGTLTGNVNNTGGTVRPGLSPGCLAVVGDYAQGPAGALDIEVGGNTVCTQFDRLAVTGSATLDGTLNAALVNGFAPPVGAAFQVMTFASRAGNFATVNGPFTVNASATDLQIVNTIPPAGTFAVTNTNDSGAGSLRQAILDSNATPGTLETITFNIAGAGVHTISPSTPLPNVTDPAVIDGTTEPDFAVGAPAVQLTGNLAGGGSDGLVLAGGGTTVRGLVINGFDGAGIRIITGGGNTVEGCLIGTNAAGSAAQGNVRGVFIDGSPNNTVGGTTAAQRNVISGNGLFGVGVEGAAATGNVVRGNFIGTDASGNAALGNTGEGVKLTTAAADNEVGGTPGGSANRIAFNGADGVNLQGGAGNAVLRNNIFSNGTTAQHLGIDLGADGLTANDANDADAGANTLQNFPVISSAIPSNGGTTLTVNGTLNSTPSTNFNVEFFSNATCDAPGNGEGRTFLGAVGVSTDAAGNANINTTLGTPTAVGEFVTATATDSSDNTSEFSACVTVTAGGSATDISWVNAAGGNWSNAANWQDGVGANRVPAAGDNVFITLAGTYTVTLDVPASVNSLTFGTAAGPGTQTFSMNGNGLTLAADSTVRPTGVFNHNGNSLARTQTGTSTLTVLGVYNWAGVGSEMTGTGTTAVAAGGQLNISSGGNLRNGHKLNNSGTVTWTGGGIGGGEGAQINNLAGGLFDSQSFDTLFATGAAPAPTFNNQTGATFRRSVSASQVIFAGFPLVNGGTLDAQTGFIDLNAGAHTFLDGTVITGAGFVRLHTGGTLAAGGTITVNGTFQLANGALDHTTTATWTGTGTFNWTDGEIRNTGTTVIAAGFDLLISGNNKTLRHGSANSGGHKLNNSGTITWTGGNISGGEGAQLNNLSGGLFDDQSGNTLGLLGAGDAPVFNNQSGAAYRKSANALSAVGFTFNNAGAVEADNGTLQFTNGYTQTAGTTTLGGGSVSFGNTLQLQGGTLGGAGNVNGNVNNTGGTVTPGLSPGCLNINGNYTQGPSGVLAIEIGGVNACAEFDRLAVTGAAALDGTLNLTLINGFNPPAGQSFRVMTFASRAGTFSTVNGPFTLNFSANDLNAVRAGGPATFTVTNTNDGGAGSLRQAILDSNATVGILDTIAFNIPNAGVQTISPASALPAVTDPAVIDGTTQPGFAGTPLVELDGTNAGATANGLSVTAGNTTVRGLAINRFGAGGASGGNAILLATNGGNVVENCVLGLTPANAPAPNNFDGVSIDASNNNRVGGVNASQANVIANNARHGVLVSNGSNGNVVQGNRVEANGGDGINVQSGTGNALQSNQLSSNAGLGIDLGPEGVTANDGAGDADAGANNLQNFPFLTSAVSDGATTNVGVLFISTPNSAFTLHFYSSQNCDASGNGEGETLVGTRAANTNNNGTDSSGASFPFGVAPGSFITATATDAAGNTSEFSPCQVVSAPPTFSISGRVADNPNNGVPGVLVTLSGSQSATATTDASGNYSFAGLAPGGNFTVTPSLSGLTFTPASRTFNDLQAHQTADFAANVVTHSISGRVTDAAGQPIVGINVTLSGTQSATTTTDPAGNYAFGGLSQSGNFNVTPSETNFNFNPPARAVNNLQADQAGLDFTAALVNHSVTGTIRDQSGRGIPGVLVTLSGSLSAVTRTDQQGDFAFPAVPANGSFTVTPEREGFTFDPPRAAINDIGADVRFEATGTPQPSPTPTPDPSDDFGGDRIDPDRWSIGILTNPPPAFDPLVRVFQSGGLLHVRPRESVHGPSYSGVVSVRALDFNASPLVSVEVVETAQGPGAETIFGLGTDDENWFRFVVQDAAPATQAQQSAAPRPARDSAANSRAGSPPSTKARKTSAESSPPPSPQNILFQLALGGSKFSSDPLAFDPAQHRFWRFRHDAPARLVIFETSPDARVWREQFRAAINRGQTALIAELSAGTFRPDERPGEALFDNFLLSPSPRLQFTTSGASASEAAGVVSVNVLRTGSTESPVSVDFTTSDGTATAGSDYDARSGTLTFEVGESFKTIEVTLNDDALEEPNETINVALSNPVGGGLGSLTRATLTVLDDDRASNPVDESEFFVRQHYRDFLGRDPDEAGLRFWTNNIESCGTDAACRDARRVDTSAAFFLSIEFQGTGYFVHRLYEASFDRAPAFAEYLPDLQTVREGVVIGEPGADARLEANKRAFAAQFVTRPDFRARYDHLNDMQYVDALFRHAGVTPSEGERTALIAGLLTNRETRAGVLQQVIEDAEFASREFNRAFVLMQYFGYLRRDPDALGFEFWLKKLDDNGGDFRAAEMVRAFITSIEYRKRFGQP